MSKWITLSILLLGLFSCEDENDLRVDQILLSIDKDIVLIKEDTIRMEVQVKDKDFQDLAGVAVKYFANGSPLVDDLFIPSRRGRYQLSARYGDLESNIETVEVIDINLDMEELILEYDSYRYLTTNDWSISGDFSFQGRYKTSLFPLKPPSVTLLLNDAPVDLKGGFHFSEAGRYRFTGKTEQLTSNPIDIQVRDRKEFPEITIPVIFHVYNYEVSQNDINRLIDTLNNSFSKSSFTRAQVLSGAINPNAVNCYIKFEAVDKAEPGKRLAGAGLNIIHTADGEYPDLSLNYFQTLEEEHNYDPNQVINFWLAPFYDFNFATVNPNELFGNSRGLSYTPYLRDSTLAGLPNYGLNPKLPDPFALSHSVLLHAGAVLGSHPDYTVYQLGYFLGLFPTASFACQSEGDFCQDTFIPDLNQFDFSTWQATSCEGVLFAPNNFMDFSRSYSNFTYDQRERLRLVLKDALFRPNL
ncbi:MAG: M43 family zinc metalloprotease [Bacteroidota bacterium]